MELRILTRLKARDIFDYGMYKTGKYIFYFFGFLFILSLGAVFSGRSTVIRAMLLLICPVCYMVYGFFACISKARVQPITETVFNQDGIFSRNETTESYWRYTDITRAVETNKYFYIFLFGAAAFIVPKYQLGSNANVVFIRNILRNYVSQTRLRLLNNNGGFNDRRKYRFDIEKEYAIAKNDTENGRRYANPLGMTFCVIGAIVVFSFYSSYLRSENGLSDNDVYDEWSYDDEDGEYINEYIEASEKLLVVADDIAEIAGNDIVYADKAEVKYSEISGIEDEFYRYYSDDESITELDRLNFKLTNRLYEIALLRVKYAGEDVSDFSSELEQLKKETLELKEKCRSEIENVRRLADQEEKTAEKE